MSAILPLAVSAAPFALTAEGTISSGETMLFWVVAPLVVLLSLSLIFSKKASYAAISLVFVMLGLAALYIAQDAMFLGVVQVIVYTGAIMMLFVFTLMLIGVDVADSGFEVIKGQRTWAALFGVGVAIGLTGIVAAQATPRPVGMDAANAETNPVAVGLSIFGRFTFAMELTGALLIVAALAAMTLTHMDRTGPRRNQKATADARMRGWALRGDRIAQHPTPGVYARSNAANVAAVGPSGTPVEESVPRALRIRGHEVPVADVAPEVLLGHTAGQTVTRSGLPGMPGEAAPVYDDVDSQDLDRPQDSEVEK